MNNVSKFSHPFTVTSSPGEENLSFHIRAVGNWTNDLKAKAQEGGEVEMRAAGEEGGRGGGGIGKVRMTGMFGGVLQNVRKYEVIVLIGAG